MERVQQVISEIHEKVKRVKGCLDSVETENEQLMSELDRLRENLSKVEQEAADFRQKYDDVKNQLESFRSESSDEGKDEQIDLLVREIDDCIQRLKSE